MTILLVGHYCHDTLLTTDVEHRALGGSSAYASAVLDALGAPYEVVAKAGRDFRYGAEVRRQPRIIQTALTTSFIDDYRHGERVGRVDALCEPIYARDVEGQYDAGLACGIAGEVIQETLEKIRAISTLALADAQSLVRAIGLDGAVVHQPLPERAAAQLDWLKASRAEAALLDLDKLRRTLKGLLITDGANGLRLIMGDTETHVPAAPATERDPTGAGDCFLAAFAWALTQGKDPLAAARFGAFCGARAVESVGVPKFDRAALQQAAAS